MLWQREPEVSEAPNCSDREGSIYSRRKRKRSGGRRKDTKIVWALLVEPTWLTRFSKISQSIWLLIIYSIQWKHNSPLQFTGAKKISVKIMTSHYPQVQRELKSLTEVNFLTSFERICLAVRQLHNFTLKWCRASIQQRFKNTWGEKVGLINRLQLRGFGRSSTASFYMHFFIVSPSSISSSERFHFRYKPLPPLYRWHFIEHAL